MTSPDHAELRRALEAGHLKLHTNGDLYAAKYDGLFIERRRIGSILALLDENERLSSEYLKMIAVTAASREAESLRSRVSELEADAAKWQALMSCERIRIMGRTLDYKHIGVEFWVKHRAAHPCAEFPQDECRADLEEFVRRAGEAADRGEG